MAELGDVSAGYQVSTLPKVADAAATKSSPESSASPRGSTSELDYQLLLARDLGHLPPDAHARLAEDVGEVRRVLYRFTQSLELSPADA